MSRITIERESGGKVIFVVSKEIAEATERALNKAQRDEEQAKHVHRVQTDENRDDDQLERGDVEHGDEMP